MKRILTLIFSVMLVLFTVFYGIHVYYWKDSGQPLAQNGLMDLSDVNFEKQELVELDGEWEFYAGVFIEPDTDRSAFEAYRDEKQLIKVPGKWDDYGTKEKPYGTYRLLIELPSEGNFGVKAGMIAYASKMYVNGSVVGSSGNVADRKSEFDNSGYNAFFSSSSKQIELVIHVSSFKVATGGITRPIKFGPTENVLVDRDLYKMLDSIVISGYLLLSILYIVSYLQQRKNMYELYFSIFCLLQGFYISAINERVLLLVLPTIGQNLLLQLQLMSIHLSVLFFLLFMYCFFKHYANKKIVVILSIILVMQSILLGPFQPIDLSSIFPIFNISIFIVAALALAYIYVLVILIKAFINKMEGMQYIINVVVSFACYGILLGVNFLFDVEFGWAPVFLFLVIAISLSSLISYRSQQAYNKVDELTKELMHFDSLKDEFLVKTSHELRTPLHVVLNLSKSVLEGRSGPLKKEQQESILLIHNVSRRLASLVETLLDAGNIKKGEVTHSPAPTSLQVVGDILEKMSYVLPDPQSVRLINKTDASLPKIYVDENRLKQILLNLIHNSIKYTEVGEITVAAKVKENKMYISVTDTGIGIKEENLNRIFASFYQVESNYGNKSKGLGLGLSIAKELVELSGGDISVTSTFGKGTCFTFTLPLAEDEHEEKVTSNLGISSLQLEGVNNLPKEYDFPVIVEGNRDYTILVVDDEHPNLLILKDMIVSLGYTVIAVDNGECALEILKDREVDLVILDLMMPNMSGFEVCKLLRENFDLFELPVIILTAAEQLSDLLYSMQIGANEFLQKPLILDELKVRVEFLLSMKSSSKESLVNELTMYYSQIKPHFLYNTLQTIIGLTYVDSSQTREALTYLATYFRAKLDFNSYRSLVPLEDELELVQAYLAIEKMRFGDRLKIIYDIDESADVTIPLMTIQPLVENAVQHGIGKKGAVGTIRFSITQIQEYVQIVIEDDGIGISKEKQTELFNGRNSRVGFTNPFKKLKLIKKASFTLESEEGIGTKITILLPRKKE
ncbi:ATP-binding protein [Ureibacillus sp. GCM10028918]|uniref:hybrid sensor histidine kinase/response regulator n=1 Tax=Ureibacillus sp. GCM10028918 TaxID=3273429 RepID=UPI00361E12B5